MLATLCSIFIYSARRAIKGIYQYAYTSSANRAYYYPSIDDGALVPGVCDIIICLLEQNSIVNW